jgi:hypothetical protein
MLSDKALMVAKKRHACKSATLATKRFARVLVAIEQTRTQAQGSDFVDLRPSGCRAFTILS